jgi:hypothetical protein
MKVSLLFNSLIYSQLINLVSSFQFFSTNLNLCDNTSGYHFQIYLYIQQKYSVYFILIFFPLLVITIFYPHLLLLY